MSRLGPPREEAAAVQHAVEVEEDDLHRDEVRTSVDGHIDRVLFCLAGPVMVLLHGFTKKSMKTPKPDLELARKRKDYVEEEP